MNAILTLKYEGPGAQEARRLELDGRTTLRLGRNSSTGSLEARIITDQLHLDHLVLAEADPSNDIKKVTSFKGLGRCHAEIQYDDRQGRVFGVKDDNSTNGTLLIADDGERIGLTFLFYKIKPGEYTLQLGHPSNVLKMTYNIPPSIPQIGPLKE